MGMTIETLKELVLGSIFPTLYVNDRERCPWSSIHVLALIQIGETKLEKYTLDSDQFET